MLRLVFAVVSFVGIAGCSFFKADNLKSCERPDNAMSSLCTDAGMMTGGACKGPDDCDNAAFPHCKLPATDMGVCVECTDNAHCPLASPVCASDRCSPCTRHADCLSEVCLPTGACAAEAEVAYVDGTGNDGAACSRQAPCKRIDEAAGKRSIVKVTGTISDRCTLSADTVQIFAATGAALKPASGIALEIKGTANIDVYDLLITKQGDAAAAVHVSEQGILKLTRAIVRDNPGPGITVTASGQATCTKCIVEDNIGRGIDVSMNGSIAVTQSTIAGNSGGGIGVANSGAFRIVSNFIFGNGRTDQPVSGGVSIAIIPQQPGAPPNELDFNSVSRNNNLGVAQGIDCASATPLVASNNIIWNNGPLQTSTQVVNTGCSYTYSNIGPTGIGTTDNNQSVNPMFVDEANGDLHLTGTVMSLLMANPNARITGLAEKDIDGDTRQNPADIGADQFTRPAAAAANVR